jgi:Putative metallopeptidase
MKRIIAAGRCVGVLAFALLVTANAARAQASSSFGNSSIEILYEPPRSIKYLPLVHRLQSFRMLEQLSEFLAPVRLPHELLLLTHECGFVNAYYTTDAQYAPLWWRIDVCYEFIEGLEHMGPRQGETSAFTYEEAVVGALVGVVLHECGHAAFDMLDVPVMGREEDAADQVAAFLALQFSKDVAPLVIRGIAYQWKSFPDPGEFRQFSDEHGTASQRFYNTLCLAYGGDAETFREFVEQGWLPAVRAPGCKAEYQQVKEAFAATILPFINREAMKEVQGREWLKLTTAQAELLREQQLKQQPTFNFAACNLSPVSNVYVALMTKDAADPHGQSPPSAPGWRVHGWYEIPDHGCSFIGAFPGSSLYYYAFGDSDDDWAARAGEPGASGQCVNKNDAFSAPPRHALPRGGSGGEFQTAGCGADGIR